MIELSAFTLLLVFVLFFTENYFDTHHLGPSLKLRIIASFILITLVSVVYEYSMSRYNQELKETTDKLELVAYIDVLTELSNRRGMLKSLDERNGELFCLLLADVDSFKKINDSYGHDVGDYCLSEVGTIIRECLPTPALSARWGGEEFLMAIPSCSQKESYELAELIRKNIEKHQFSHQGYEFNLTLSFGIASMSESISLREAISVADGRLYKAKQSGRNQVCQL